MSKSLKESINELSAKFSKQSRRDQFLILIAALFVIILPLYTYGVKPQLKKTKSLELSYQNLQNELSSSENLLNEFTLKLQQDPSEAMRKEIVELNTKTSEISKKLSQITADFIPAFDMPKTLQEVLSDIGSLKLISVNSIAPTVIIKDDKSKVVLYKHGTKLILEGNYLDAMRYLQILENLDKKFIWGDFSYELKTYPAGRIEINVYTLSNGRDFISG